MATWVGRGRIHLTSFNSPTPKPPTTGNISYTSWVIAHFVSNFVAMATRVGRCKIWLHDIIRLPVPKTPC